MTFPFKFFFFFFSISAFYLILKVQCVDIFPRNPVGSVSYLVHCKAALIKNVKWPLTRCKTLVALYVMFMLAVNSFDSDYELNVFSLTNTHGIIEEMVSVK